MKSVELFAGCGGLALGIADAGFKHVLVVEQNRAACATLRENKKRGVKHLKSWPLIEADARTVNFADVGEHISLVSGGPPCQPFSIGGVHRGPGDPRNMWREAIRAVRELQPSAFLFENVRGLLRPGFAEYLAFLKLQLAWPEIAPRKGSSWREHLPQLRRRHRSKKEPSYRVVVAGINAADYGAPQKRHRAIVLGLRSDLATEIQLPPASHSRAALVWSQRVTNEYWERHKISRRARPPLSASDSFFLEKIRSQDKPKESPWRTVRDAIGDLPAPRCDREVLLNHRLHEGARIYPPRHTGSTWDEPAKALKAGDHGVPGGENILVLREGEVRYFTLREMARLQGLPDNFHIPGTWMDPIKQLGNAVPVQVGRAFGVAIRRWLEQGCWRSSKDAEI